jgi:hypothetical protein
MPPSTMMPGHGTGEQPFWLPVCCPVAVVGVGLGAESDEDNLSGPPRPAPPKLYLANSPAASASCPIISSSDGCRTKRVTSTKAASPLPPNPSHIFSVGNALWLPWGDGARRVPRSRPTSLWARPQAGQPQATSWYARRTRTCDQRVGKGGCCVRSGWQRSANRRNRSC